MDELQQFKDTYITECFELLEEMEERLMQLTADAADTEELNAIFRCAHSIKGGAGAFGFEAIAHFTHILEALLDLMREDKVAASSEVIDTLLRARDVVYQMVLAAQEGRQPEEGFGSEVAQKLESFTGTTSTNSAPASAPTADESVGVQTYRITFTPHREMLIGGNEPLLLLRELASLGETDTKCNLASLPSFDSLQPEHCYLSWHITLKSDHPRARIDEVFEFVEDECELTIEVETPEQTETPAITKQEANPTGPKATPPAASIRVDIDKVDTLINMVGEVVITQAFLSAQVADLASQEHAALIRGIDEMMHHTRELQEAVMAVRMQPVKSIFARMPRLVRDLAGQLGKDMTLEMQGEQTEVDKTIIEQLADPLTHMIRNSADHGIESPDIREAAGKPRQGTIQLSAEHRGGRIVIEIKDDGGGINREKVHEKAIDKGVITADANLTDEEIDQLIFAPGFSTADQVSSVSGRGVGMDVVRRNIESLGGNVLVENHPGEGSTFAISLPLTLAILDGMIVRCGREYYIIPIGNIIETLRPKSGEVKPVADGSHVVNVRGEFLPILYLYQILRTPGAEADAAKALVVIVENGNQQFGLVVDELVGQQQVVIKSLEENADPVDGIAGATILGDGKVSLILDIAALQHLSQTPPNAPRPKMKQPNDFHDDSTDFRSELSSAA